MPNNYKDFSQYNEAAEEIRPSARIQLIQRILNAANIISNLAAGVPLRWANAYKSFQVLVPNEQGAPTDYTTDEAVSSVNSILHEAESQLKSSQDDMNTLSSELEKFSIHGTIDTSNLGFILSETWVRFDNWVHAIWFDHAGNPMICRRMTEAEWGNLASNKIDLTDIALSQKLNYKISTDTADYRSFSSFNFYRRNHLSNKVDDICNINISREPNAGAAIWYVAVSLCEINSTVGETSVFTINPVSTSDYSPTHPGSDPDDTGILTNVAIEIDGFVDAGTALGLPDPTDVISILDSME